MGYENIPAGGSPFFGDPVQAVVNLPTTGLTGELRLVISTNVLYSWDGMGWALVTGGGGGSAAWGAITGTLSNQLDLQSALNAKEPTFTTLAVSKGGTNSGTALNNNRVMRSSGGVIGEAAAITAARALISDANGIPTQSATTSTELAFVSGVASAIQTQFTGKQPVDATLTALAALNPSSGFIAATAADTFTTRTHTGTANEITVTNGNGVSGNPTYSLPALTKLHTATVEVGGPSVVAAVGGLVYAMPTIIAESPAENVQVDLASFDIDGDAFGVLGTSMTIDANLSGFVNPGTTCVFRFFITDGDTTENPIVITTLNESIVASHINMSKNDAGVILGFTNNVQDGNGTSALSGAVQLGVGLVDTTLTFYWTGEHDSPSSATLVQLIDTAIYYPGVPT